MHGIIGRSHEDRWSGDVPDTSVAVVGGSRGVSAVAVVMLDLRTERAQIPRYLLARQELQRVAAEATDRNRGLRRKHQRQRQRSQQGGR